MLCCEAMYGMEESVLLFVLLLFIIKLLKYKFGYILFQLLILQYNISFKYITIRKLIVCLQSVHLSCIEWVVVVSELLSYRNINNRNIVSDYYCPITKTVICYLLSILLPSLIYLSYYTFFQIHYKYNNSRKLGSPFR